MPEEPTHAPIPGEEKDGVQFESTIKRLLGIDPNVQLPSAEPSLPRMESADRYTVVAEIAEGGMGRILKVYDHNLKRCVAMKVVIKRGEEDTYAFQKFVEEAQVNAQLEHPNIVPTYDIGIDKDGNLYFTMRMVHGQSLREIIQGLQGNVPEMTREFTLLKRLQLFMQAANAIGYAHSKGVVHRDIKPDNIMVGRFGEVFVMDWGLAKILGRAQERSSADTFVRIDPRADVTKTVEGTIAGTPFYMAPEQALGKIEEIDARTDIYALGAVLFELITLTKPVAGEDADQVIVRVAKGRLQPVPGSVPRELAAIMRKALAFKREERYQSVPELIADIQAYLEGRRGSAWQDNVLTLAIKWVRRHAAVSAVTVGALAVLLGYMIYTWTRPGQLNLESVPAGARVWVDGEEVGNTPLRHPLTPGRHTVRLAMSGYDDSVQEIHLQAGSTSEHRFVLNSISQVVSIVSNPTGAEFEIYGSAAQSLYRGTTPQAVLLPRGTYRLVISKLGYVVAERTITVRGGGGLLPFDPVTLDKNMGTLRIDSYQEGVIATILRRGQPDPVRTITLPLHDPVELPTGAYEIEFSHDQYYPVTRAALVEKDKETRLGVFLQPAVLWEFRPNGAVYSSPALADVNGDGTIDAVMSTMDGEAYSLVAVSGRDGGRLWSVKVGRSRISSLAAACADFNRDGRSDVVFGSQEKFVGALDGKDGAKLWECPTNGEVDLAVALSDLNGDGIEDVAAISRASVVYAINGKDGTILWEFGSQIPPTAPPVLGDLTGDGTADVVLVTIDARVIVLDGTAGRIVWQLQLPSPARPRQTALSEPVLGDLNGDQVPDIVVYSAHMGRLFAVNGRGSGTLWDIGLLSSERPMSALADVNQDRVPDLLLVAENRSIVALSGRDGTTLWMQNVGFAVTSPLSVGDMNQDGVFDVVFCRSDGRLQALSGKSGEPLAQFKVKGAVAFFMAPAIADVNRDGALDIVFCDFTRCTLFAGRNDKAVSFVAGESGGTCTSTLEDATGDGTPELVFTAQGILRVVSLEREKVVDVKIRALTFPFAHFVKTLGDADGDGKPDVLVGSEKAIHLISGRDGSDLWTLEIDESGYKRLHFGDLNGDKVLDFVVDLRSKGRLVAYSGLDGKPLWTRAGPIAADVRIAELNGDGKADVLVPADAQTLVALSGPSGELLWKASAGGRVLSFFEYGSDVVITTNMRVKILSGVSGKLVREFAGTQEYLQSAGVDLNGDGVMDLASAPGYGSVVYCYSGDNGNRLFGARLAGMLVGGPVFGDLDGDGRLEAVVLTTLSTANWEALKLVVLSTKDGGILWEFILDSTDALSLLNARLTLVGRKIVISTGPRVFVFSAFVRPDPWLWQAESGPSFSRSRLGQ